jgi:thioredoxin reductase (NADPH)
MESYKTDIVVIGAGPVGLFAVFQAGMLGMQCHVIDALPAIGGQCSALYPEKPIYDIPSRPVVTGSDLIANLQEQAAPFNAQCHLNQQVMAVEDQDDDWAVTTSSGIIIKTRVIIIAAGAGAFVPNRPPLNGIDDYEGQSVLYVVRDKSKFKDKNIMIAGGGDSAVDWAVALSDVAKSVNIVHRRDKFRAMPESIKMMHDLAKKNPDTFRILTPYQLSQLHGSNGILDSVSIETLDGDHDKIAVDYLIPLYGLKPDLGPIASLGLNIDANTIAVDQSTCETSRCGIFAVGDIAHYDKKLKLILSGFSEVASACHHAHHYVFPDKALHFEYSTSKGVVKD